MVHAIGNCHNKKQQGDFIVISIWFYCYFL